MRAFLLLGCAVLAVTAVKAQIIVDQQPTDYGNGREGDTSTSYSDMPSLSIYGLDDFTLASDTTVASVRTYGWLNGGPPLVVRLRIQQNGSHTNPGTIFADVRRNSQYGSDWTFEIAGLRLNAGSYWLEAWWQGYYFNSAWFWANSSANGTSGVRGEECRWHNPGGGFGFGTNPIPISQTGLHGPRDFAFTIYGTPEPGTLVGVGMGFIAALAASRRRK